MKPEDIKEPTVEEALDEIKEMFKGKWIAFDCSINNTIGPRGKHSREMFITMQVEAADGTLIYNRDARKPTTLHKAMTALRKWKESQS